MLDKDGYRPNVGIILVNGRNEVFWGKRIREHSWQFPQGGIKRGETPEQAMFRELEEETGLRAEHVRIIGRTRNWLRYNVPENWVRREWRGHYRGQKQIWFLLRMVGRDTDVRLRASSHPEFDAWRWNEYWVPLEAVIEFKRDVYLQALTELSRFLAQQRHRDAPRYLRKRRDGNRPPDAARGDPARGGPRPPADLPAGVDQAAPLVLTIERQVVVEQRATRERPSPQGDRPVDDAPQATVGQQVTIQQRVTVALDDPLADRRIAAFDAQPIRDASREPPR